MNRRKYAHVPHLFRPWWTTRELASWILWGGQCVVPPGLQMGRTYEMRMSPSYFFLLEPGIYKLPSSFLVSIFISTEIHHDSRWLSYLLSGLAWPTPMSWSLTRAVCWNSSTEDRNDAYPSLKPWLQLERADWIMSELFETRGRAWVQLTGHLSWQQRINR